MRSRSWRWADRDRAYYPVALIVIGSYYVLFAAMAGDASALRAEIAIGALFAACAVIGFRTSLWIVAAGTVLHGVFDFARQPLFPGSGAPPWWPAFCGAIDIAIGAGLAVLLLRGRIAAKRPSETR